MNLRRRTGAAFAALAVAVGPTAAAASSAPAEPSPSPAGTLPLSVTLAGLSPIAPQPGDTLQISGTLQNVSTTPVSTLAVHLAVSPTKVGSRGAFDTYADTVDGAAPADAVDIPPASVSLPRPDLAVAASEHFQLTVAVNDLPLPEAWQVYELAVSVTGTTPLGESTLGRLRTFLPWAPLGVPGVGLPTRLAWVWPVVDRPHRSSDTVWTDDALASELTPGGRLGGIVAAGEAAAAQHNPPPPKPKRQRKHPRRRQQPTKVAPPKPDINPVPVTWAIDPLLVDDATLMAAGYKVGAGSDRTTGAGRDAAHAWLTSLRSATSQGEVLALPYADPDVVAASRWGPALGTEVQVATNAGQSLLTRALGSTPLPYAWPPDGLADQRTLDTLFAGGVTTVVLDSQALPVIGGDESETPGAHTTVQSRDSNLDALLSDHTLTDVVQGGATDPSTGPLAVQRMLSELLMIQAERPSDQRSLVIAPDRRWAPSPAYAGTLLADTGRVPWIQPVTLSQVADGPRYTKVERAPTVTYPASERALQLRHGYLEGVAAIKRRTDAFAAILPPGDAQARGFDSGVLRLLSSAWRSDPVAAVADRDALAADVARTMLRVRIASHNGSLVTLTSRSGTVPVTITNDLDTPVRVVLGIDPGQHLQVTGARIVHTIAPHRQVPVDIRATARTSGIFPLTVTLYTPTTPAQQYGARVRLLVRSTAYGATALLITGGATAVLLLTVAVRLTRRARAATRTARADA